jgi:hypothetical protein
MVAALQVRKRGGQDGRHAGGGADAAFGAFERGEPVLEHLHGGIGVAGVHHALLFAGEARRRLARVVEDEARGEEERLGMLLELGTRLAGAHALGCDLVFFGHKKTRSSRLSGPGFLGTL